MNPFLREAPARELICLYHLLPAHDVLGILNPSGRQKGGYMLTPSLLAPALWGASLFLNDRGATDIPLT